MNIELMTYADLDEVCEIENMSFSVPWSRESFENELTCDYAVYLVARDGGMVKGYIGMHNICGEGEITMIAVHPHYRKKGIGDLLLNELISRSKQLGVFNIFLEVREGNVAAKKLYKNLGFKEYGIRKNYYTNPTENALLMTRNICGKE